MCRHTKHLIWFSIYFIKNYTVPSKLTSSFMPISSSSFASIPLSSSSSSSLYMSSSSFIPMHSSYSLPMSFSVFTFTSPSCAGTSKSSSTFILPMRYAQSYDVAYVSLDEPGRMCRDYVQLCKTNIT
jgi:hypothetical protein